VCENLGLDIGSKVMEPYRKMSILGGLLGFWPFRHIENINILIPLNSSCLDINKYSIK
jgi:hypothetical protein